VDCGAFPQPEAANWRKLRASDSPGVLMGRAKAAAKNFTVDMWWTGLNDVEVGLFVHSRHRAKSRQFTADSDVIGEVLEGGERAGLITYREGLWKSDDPGAKRVVLKLFTPAMTWRGSIDLLIGRATFTVSGANPKRDADPALPGPCTPSPQGRGSTIFQLCVDDVDAVLASATASGAIVRTAAQDAGWGDRVATIIDPFGYIWALATIQRELTAEEFNARGNIQLVEAA
jgi:uncharacterized glyoxalase superfamily protein PhnB